MTDEKENKAQPVEFSFALLLGSVSRMHSRDVVRWCELELARANRRIARRLDVQAVWFALQIRGFLFFLNTGEFLASSKPDAPAYRAVVEALVQKGEVDKSLLEAVDREIDDEDGGGKKSGPGVKQANSFTSRPERADGKLAS